VKPDAYLVGEVWHVDPAWVSGDRFHALMNYPLAEAILSFAGGTHLDSGVITAHHEFGPSIRRTDGPAFARRLEELHDAYDPAVVAVQLNLLGSHDSPRALSVLGGDRAAVRLAVLLQATLPGAPCIYYGDEIGLAGGNDPACRGSFPTDQTTWDRDLHAFVSAALAVRHAHPALRRGGMRVVAAQGDAIALERRLDGECLVVAVNAGEDLAMIEIDRADGEGRPLVELPLPWPQLRPEGRLQPDARGRLVVALPGRSGRVLRAV
jgi:neopullulanase